jgi:hypothetical protein
MYLGDGAALQIEQTDSIASEISGKYRFVVRDSGAPIHDSRPAAPTKKTHAPA